MIIKLQIMKKLSLLLVFIFALGISTTSCREEKNDTDIEMSTDDDAMSTDDDAAEEVEDAVEEGVDEVKENTGMGGEDDM